VEHLLASGLSSGDIQLTNARGVFKRSLAEFAVLGILFHYKRVRRLIDNQRQHIWERISVKFADERVMGIVGYGEIGRECALLAKGLGLKIHGLRRNPERSARDPLLDRVFGMQELDEMLRNVDVLLCAAPLTPQTRHMDRQCPVCGHENYRNCHQRRTRSGHRPGGIDQRAAE
jgi:phosphoglycerate dehydrogenase-like enzyme